MLNGHNLLQVILVCIGFVTYLCLIWVGYVTYMCYFWIGNVTISFVIIIGNNTKACSKDNLIQRLTNGQKARIENPLYYEERDRSVKQP